MLIRGDPVFAEQDIASAISGLYLNNIASKPKADHFCDGRDMSSIKYQKETPIKFQTVENPLGFPMTYWGGSLKE